MARALSFPLPFVATLEEAIVVLGAWVFRGHGRPCGASRREGGRGVFTVRGLVRCASCAPGYQRSALRAYVKETPPRSDGCEPPRNVYHAKRPSPRGRRREERR